VTLEITSYDGSSKSRSVLKFVRPTSLAAPVRLLCPRLTVEESQRLTKIATDPEELR
jgi:hypothetical protein